MSLSRSSSSSIVKPWTSDQAREAIALQHGFGGLQQSVAQRAVMVRGFFARGGSPRRAWFPSRARRRATFWRGSDAGLGIVGLSRHPRFIGPDFDTVKISLDRHRDRG